jgi:hypothetical protein
METQDLRALSTAAFHALGSDQLGVLSTHQFAALSTAQIVALGTDQIAGLSTDHIAALTTAQTVALETADIAAMSLQQVAAITPEDLGVMTGAQISALLSVTPIVLDLAGTGIHTSAASQGVSFDLAATGSASRTGWIAEGSALLALDRNHDGVINDGSELFGIGTRMADGTRAANGYAALAQLDGNHDGVISAADAAFKDLRVWVDANHDGKTDAGELKSLADVGVVSLDLHALTGSQVDHGNLLGLVSSVTMSAGSQHQMADVWFAKEKLSTPTVQLNELLAAPAGEVLAHDAAHPATAVASAPAAHLPNPALSAEQHRLLAEDAQRNGPLI